MRVGDYFGCAHYVLLFVAAAFLLIGILGALFAQYPTLPKIGVRYEHYRSRDWRWRTMTNIGPLTTPTILPQEQPNVIVIPPQPLVHEEPKKPGMIA